MKFRSLLGLLIILTSVYTESALAIHSVWTVLRQEFKLNHETNQVAVQHQLHWLISHPSYLHKLAQSEPYIYHIVTEIKKRNIPGELALIPMIESAFDPFAYSGVGAAGLWQLMPGTGTDLGLKQDWWFDARRSIGPSTDAALGYLVYLYNYFNGNWLLAVAAYDSGEGTIARSIKNSHQSGRHVNFWSLPVPTETRAYIPRLLALAEIIQNPQRYHVQLPDIPHIPYFEEVNIGSQIDLSHAAKLAGISYQDLIKLNPGYNRWATAPYRPYKLLIPADRVNDFSRNLANLPLDRRVSLMRHQVSAGDNLMLIAQRYHTTVNLIKELNQLKSNAVKKGQYVMIPSNKNTSTTVHAIAPSTPHFTALQQYKTIHIVQKQETFLQLEKQYAISKKDIQTWNHLKPQDPLHQGQQLVIWKQAIPTGYYTVKAGDSLSSIASQHHMLLAALKHRNPALKHSLLHPGQRIFLG